MERKEMTLGEEIINLAKEGVDIPTVERMYKKYLRSQGIVTNALYGINPTVATPSGYIDYAKAALNNIYGVNSAFCKKYVETDDADVEFMEKFFSDHVRKPTDIWIGRQFIIELSDLGQFGVTVHRVYGDWVLLMFDSYITKRPMNENGRNEGGYEKSDLKKWIDVKLFNQFPEEFRKRMFGLTILTIGEMFGWSDRVTSIQYELDADEQLPYMEQERNRCTHLNDCIIYGWLQNASKPTWSTACFASVDMNGDLCRFNASYSGGVRPRFWLYIK